MKDLSQLLADKLRNKATEITPSSLGLLEWSKKYLGHYFTRKHCDLHTQLSQTIDSLRINRGRKEVLQVPRGYAKTTYCSFAAILKAICEGSEHYILLCSDTTDQAVLYLKNIKDELKNNEALIKAYPLACKEGETWASERIETGNNVCVEALGKGKNVRGRRFKQYRPTLIVLDDPQSDVDVASASTRGKDIEWLDKALIPAGDSYTNYLIVGNNIHRESIIGTASSRVDFHVIKFAAINKMPHRMDMWDTWEEMYIAGDKDRAHEYLCNNFVEMSEGAEVIWHDKETLLDLMIMRANIGHAAFDAEKQNNPRDPTKAEFSEDWFTDTTYHTLPADVQYITVGVCDPAKGLESKRRDFAPIITGHYSPELRKCFLEVDMERRPVTMLVDAILEWHRQVKYVSFGIESNGFQQLVGEELIAKSGGLMPVSPIYNYGVHKNTRISRLSIWLQRKFFVFKANCRSTKILLQQLLDHPNSDHDDGPDALEMLLRILTSVSDLDNTQVVDVGDDGLGDNLCALFG